MARRYLLLGYFCATFLLHGVVNADPPPERPAPVLFPAIPDDPAERGALARQQARDPRLVRLHAAVFDPLQQREPEFDELLPRGPVLREPTGADPLLIQLEEPLTPTVRAELLERGFDVLGYVPNRTLVVRPRSDASRASLQFLSGRRWVGTFLPGYKLAPDLFHILLADEPYPEDLTLDVILFRGEDAAPLVYAIEEQFETVRIVYVKQRQPSRITLDGGL